MARDWTKYSAQKKPSRDWTQYKSAQREPMPEPIPVPEQSESLYEKLLMPKSEENLYETITKPRDWGMLGSALTGAERSFSELPLGILQLALNNPHFVQEENARRNQAYEMEKQKNPMSTMLGYGGAKIVESLPLMMAGPAGAEMIMGRLAPHAPKFATYLAKALATPAAGAGRGALEYVEPEGSRTWNAIKGALTNTLAKGVGNVLGGAFNLGKSYIKTHPAEDFAKRMLQNMKSVQKDYGQKYAKIIKGNKDLPIELPKINFKDIFSKASKDEKKYLKNLPENLTIGNAHKIQSDLGKMLSRLGKLKPTNAVTDAKNAALKAQEKLRNAIASSFEKHGKGGLAKEYESVTKGYAKDVIPYKESRAIKKLKEGKFTPEDFRKAIGSEKTFKAQLGQHQYPELYQFPEATKMIGKGLGGIGAYSTANYLGLGK